MKDPVLIYQQEIEKYSNRLLQLQTKRKLLGWLRFAVFIVTAIIAYKIFVTAGIIGLFAVAAGIAVLLAIISVDADNKNKIINTEMLIKINNEELELLNNNYRFRYDGIDLLPPVHDYANDLDLFGKSSLYQLVNRCFTEQGKHSLAADFLSPLPAEKIRERQEALKELLPACEWRQQLQSFAMKNEVTIATQRRIAAWLAEKEDHFTNSIWKVIVPIYSVLTVATAVAAILGYLSSIQFGFLFAAYFAVSGSLSKNATKAYAHLSGIVKEVATLQQLVEWIEGKSFQASLLKRLQQNARVANSNAGSQIRELKNILDRFDYRLNIFGPLLLNSFLLWDVRQMMALNEWRQKNKEPLPEWFELIAGFEVLNSITVLQFNYPDWCLPQLSNIHFTFVGKEIGHPLIPLPQRVTSDFSLEGTAKIGLITGSNMAGKSTFLRSLGVNSVLAQMGAPVCCKSLLLSPVHLMSSMRIADNLAENTSTFYAELKKLKTIIEAVNRHENIFILLDEILRGTNSLDRHTGSKALIAQLIRERAVAVIATHDIELAGLQDQFPASIENYHFDVQVEGEELYFDYKLKEGVCTSLNASILMKKIGIEV